MTSPISDIQSIIEFELKHSKAVSVTAFTENDFHTYSAKAAQAITALLEAAIGEDEPEDTTDGDYWEKCARNQLRAEIRAKLGLPTEPTDKR